jgi:hypothetical protein
VLFPEGVALEELDSLVDEMHIAWSAYLSRLDTAELAREFHYRSLEGQRYRNTDIRGTTGARSPLWSGPWEANPRARIIFSGDVSVSIEEAINGEVRRCRETRRIHRTAARVHEGRTCHV